MKTINVLLIGIFAVLLFSSCSKKDGCLSGEGDRISRTYVVSSFDRLAVHGDAEIYISKDSSTSLRIEGQSNILNELNIDDTGGKLEIGEDNCFKNMKTLKIYVSTPSLRGIDTYGANDVVSNDSFTGTTFYANQSGSGSMNLMLNVAEFTSSISGSGNIRVTGNAIDQFFRISGDGNYECFGLVGDNGDIDISGSGDVEINVSKTLNIEVSGSGNIYYKGNPTITQKVSGSANIVNVP